MRIVKIACFVLVVAVATTAWAQTLDRGEVRGTVTDPTGAVVPGTKVTISNPATGFRRTVEAGDSGLYVLAQIPAGEYEVEAEHTGFAPITITGVRVSVGSVLSLNLTLPVAGLRQTITVLDVGGVVDTTTAGISQLLNAESVANLPIAGRDFRDLAQLSPSAQVVPGLRGGIRLGGQQSDYAGLVIDGGDAHENFFGENFGSLETKNFTIPIEAVQEFQVVSNGFAPEFGRATGGLINVVTKSGTNEVHGSVHYFVRGEDLTADDALGTPPNIRLQQQFGASVGFPLVKDKQFLFFAFDRQDQDGPLLTQFARDVSGVSVPAPFNIADLSSLEGSNTQEQKLFSGLVKYDWQINPNHHFSARSFFTRNSTIGFTGGRGQNLIQNSFDNTEEFRNQGVNTIVGVNSVWGRALNEMRVMFSFEERPRNALSDNPEVQILDTGTFGRRFFLPIDGESNKVQVLDNFEYIFGKHDMKFGGDVNMFFNQHNSFAGWSRGTYFFGTLEDFGATAADQTANLVACGFTRCPFGFIQGFGLGGQDVFEAGALDTFYQTAIGLYWQDKWQVSDRLTLTYGLRWDSTINPTTQSGTPGNEVYAGRGAPGSGSNLIAPPQDIPDDNTQIGPRVGVAYSFGANRSTVLRGAWGLYYAQIPPIFFPIGGNERGTTLFCFFPGCQPRDIVPGADFPDLFPSAVGAGDPVSVFLGGAPGITYVDPDFRNPRVSNLNLTLEHQFAQDWTVSGSYVFVHSERLRTGGFSSTQWERNVVVASVDSFGRSILAPDPIFGPLRQDPTLGSTQALASFSRGNYQQVVISANKRFSKNYLFFANYSWSRNKDNAASERDTDSFFGPQDPFNIELDYGRNGLDITHQFKSAFVVEAPYGFTLSASAIARSGLAYPAYILDDINGDGVSNQGIGTNDRPVVGGSFLLPRYPGRQPDFFQLDFRINKSIKLSEGVQIQALVEFFNLFDRDNLFSNPNIASFVNNPLAALPQPGDIGPTGVAYRDLSAGGAGQISPGSTPFAVQFGVKLVF